MYASRNYTIAATYSFNKPPLTRGTTAILLLFLSHEKVSNPLYPFQVIIWLMYCKCVHKKRSSSLLDQQAFLRRVNIPNPYP